MKYLRFVFSNSYSGMRARQELGKIFQQVASFLTYFVVFFYSFYAWKILLDIIFN